MNCPWCDGNIPEESEFCPECGIELAPVAELPEDEGFTRPENMPCLRCDGTMASTGEHKFQLGEHGFLFGDLSHLFRGALKVEIFLCQKCGKLEFFATQDSPFTQQD